MSSLALQLQKLQTTGVARRKASLLFDINQAANIDLETLHTIALEGLEELERQDDRFTSFRETLLSRDYVSIDRDVRTKDWNQKLDQSISEFLRLLSPFFLLRPAHKILEYFIRRYRIHEYNADSVMSGIIPYHETNIFARMVQLLTLSKTWEFLEPTRKTGTPLDHKTLVTRCSIELSLPEFIGESVKTAASTGTAYKGLFSFWGVLMSQAVMEAKRVDAILNRILPYVLEGLKSRKVDYQTASFMIVSSVATKTPLTPALLESVLSAIATGATSQSFSDCLLCLILLCQTQTTQIKTIPEAVRTFATKFPEFLPTLQEFIASGYNINSFLKLIIDSLVDVAINEQNSFGLLLALIQEIPVAQQISVIVTRLISDFQKFTDDKHQANIKKILRAIESRYPKQLEESVRSHLKSKKDANKSKVLEFIQLSFKGTRHELLRDSSTTLFLSLEHPDPKIRLLALQELYNKRSQLDGQFMQESLLNRLADDNEEVVHYALDTLPALAHLYDPSSLFDRITRLFLNVKSRQVDPKIRQKALKILSNALLSSHPEYVDKILPLIFQHVVSPEGVVIPPNVKMAFKINHPFAAKLKTVLTAPSSRTLEKLIDVLSANFNAHCEKLMPMCEALLADESTRKLIVAVINQSFNSGLSEESQLEIAMRFVPTLKNHIGHVSVHHIQKIRDSLNHLKEPSWNQNSLQSLWQADSNAVATYYLAFIDNVLKSILSGKTPEQILGNKKINTFLVMVFKSAFDSLRHVGLFENILKTLVAEVKHVLLHFLSQFWLSDDSTYETKIQVAALRMSTVFVSQKSGIDYQMLGPSVLILLANPEKEIRQAAMDLLQEIKPQSLGSNAIWGSSPQLYESVRSKKSHPQIKPVTPQLFAQFVSFVLDSKDEILADHRYVRKVMRKALASGQKSFSIEENEDLQKFLMSHFDAFDSLDVKCRLLRVLESVSSPTKLNSTLPYMQTLHSGKISEREQKILRLLLRQFNEDTTSLLNEDEEAFRTYLSILDVKASDEGADGSIPVAVENRLAVLSSISEAFYNSLTEGNKSRLFRTLCRILQFGEPEPRSVIHKIFEDVSMDASIFCDVIDEVFTGKEPTPIERTPKKKKQTPKEQGKSSKEIQLNSIERVNVVLEILQYKSTTTIYHGQRLIAKLFQLLSELVDMEQPLLEQAIEYTKQLVLSSLSKLSVSFSQENNLANKDALEKEYNIDSVVNCLRVSQNPQTHHQAILMLSSIAPLFPKKIVDHVVPLYTFMGSSTLRQDTDYSFFVVQKAIQTIVPVVLNHGVQAQSVLSIFANAVFEIPTHKRIALFSLLIETSSVESFFMVLIFLFAKYIDVDSSPITLDAKEIQQQELIALCHNLCNELSPLKVLTALAHVMEDISRLPKDKQYIKRTYSSDEVFKIKHVLIEFIADHLASKEFLDSLLAVQSSKDTEAIQKLYMSLFTLLLRYFQQANEVIETKSSKKVQKMCRAIMQSCENALYNLNALLSTSSFVGAIDSLLQHNDPQIRRRALVILNDKISNEKEAFSEKEVQQYIQMVDTLVTIVDTKDSSAESEINKQASLMSLEILARHFGHQQPATFAKALPTIAKILVLKNPQLVSSAIICIATLSAETGPLAVPQLPRFFPLLVKSLQASFDSTSEEAIKERTLMQLSALSSVQVIVTVLSKFINPYLSSLISALVDPKVLQFKNPKISSAVEKILTVLATDVPSRIIMDHIMTTYEAIMKTDQAEPFVLLMKTMSTICKQIPVDKIETEHKRVFKFLLSAFEFRVKKSKLSLSIIEKVENSIISAFGTLVMKLNEVRFKPIFLKMVEWAHVSSSSEVSEDTDENTISRRIFFYKVSNTIADKLKSIFVPYYSHFLENAISCLENLSIESNEKETDRPATNQLIEAVMNSLHRCFLHDTDAVLTKENFGRLMPAVVNQLENTNDMDERYEERVEKNIVPCLAQLAVCVRDDTLWKPLNYQVLLKTRSESPRVRLSALKVVEEYYNRLKEELLVLIPETIPFLSELMEDSDPKVEQLTRHVIATMEQYLGQDTVSSFF
eukprot:TRINITY_DN6557_c0_g1_i2.p1 TRINITY_DN6557_c0_g1~~TRINITY_DN6557_c0_g1_i2.p1  ORF type:complete len:2043 (+),score=611.24 TRINITY_DN6557_c0_g1_i2:150-6278(+)